jgi:hypothetical protein
VLTLIPTGQIKRLQQNGTLEHEFSIFWVPRRTLVCQQILEDEGIIGDVSAAELPLYFLPLEDDLFSLERPDSFGDLYLVRVYPPRCASFCADLLTA